MYRFAIYDPCAEDWEDGFVKWIGKPFDDPNDECIVNTLAAMHEVADRNPKILYNAGVMKYDGVDVAR